MSYVLFPEGTHGFILSCSGNPTRERIKGSTVLISDSFMCWKTSFFQGPHLCVCRGARLCLSTWSSLHHRKELTAMRETRQICGGRVPGIIASVGRKCFCLPSTFSPSIHCPSLCQKQRGNQKIARIQPCPPSARHRRGRTCVGRNKHRLRQTQGTGMCEGRVGGHSPAGGASAVPWKTHNWRFGEDVF